jgi:hypothetical protein
VKEFGGALLVLGLVLCVGALLYEPTVSSGGGYGYGVPAETYNLGKLQYQELFFTGGVGLIVAGSVLFGIGALIGRLEASGVLTPVAPAALIPEGKVCDWCGVNVPSPNRPCSALDESRWAELAPNVTYERCREQLRERGFLPEVS